MLHVTCDKIYSNLIVSSMCELPYETAILFYWRQSFLILELNIHTAQDKKNEKNRILLIFQIQTLGRTPEKMENISIVPQEIFQDKDKINFEEDDVLQLQCIGEVESINDIPSKVRTCILNRHLAKYPM